MQSSSQYDFAQSTDNPDLNHSLHRNTVLFQINQQQTEQLQKHQDKQNVSHYQREINALDHELAQMEKLHPHCGEKYCAQAKHYNVLY
jgi:hypothetical protein